MIEVEVKVPVKDRESVEQKLSRIGFIKGDLLKETDVYFDSGLRKKDTALRIRSCENRTRNSVEYFMTFKGPKMDNISMTRKELEMKIENGDTGKDILTSLGYAPISPLIKFRQLFRLDEMNACLDNVNDLGTFLELEIVVPSENEKDAALNKILSLLRELGYEPQEIIRTSYLSMLQKKNKYSKYE